MCLFVFFLGSVFVVVVRVCGVCVVFVGGVFVWCVVVFVCVDCVGCGVGFVCV